MEKLENHIETVVIIQATSKNVLLYLLVLLVTIFGPNPTRSFSTFTFMPQKLDLDKPPSAKGEMTQSRHEGEIENQAEINVVIQGTSKNVSLAS